MKNKLIKILKPFVERFPRLAMTYRFLRDSWQIQCEPEMTPFGFRFVGNKVIQTGDFEKEETAILNRLLNKIDVFINVGANTGYYCCIALQQNKKVIAFEPISLNLSYLLQNIRANNWESMIEIYPIVLNDRESGIVEIYGGGTNASIIKGWSNTPEQFVTIVPCSTLDNILKNKLTNRNSLIVVDIEGAEHLMLKGARETLQHQPKPIWMMEVSVNENQPKNYSLNPNLYSTFQFFWDHGYEAFTADDRLKLVTSEDIKLIENKAYNILKTHNFLFIEYGMKGYYLN